MSELSPDVRDRAATAARAAWLNASAPVAETWPAVVDAVAEVLAAEQPKWMHANIADCAETEREVVRLQARVAELEGALTGLIHYINSASAIPMSTQLRAVLADATDVLTNETS